MCTLDDANSFDYCNWFARFLAGDAEAAGLLWPALKALAEPVVRAVGVQNHDVEEVAGDAATHVMSEHVASGWDRDYCVATWFNVVARYWAIDVLRNASRRMRIYAAPGSDLASLPELTQPDGLEVKAEVNRKIQKTLASLPPAHRKVLELTMRDLKAKEITEATDIPVNTVRVYLMRARQELCRLLRDLDFKREFDAIRRTNR